MVFLSRKRASLEAFLQKLLESHEQERKRIAADLHGSVGQNLLVMKNRAELGLASGASAAAMAEQFKGISEVCSIALEETRRTAHQLGPQHLQQIGLTGAVDAMIDRVAASTGIRFERRLELVDDLFEPEAATNLYRIAQEALNNVMKHARASSARVGLLRDLRQVELSVQDNGCGYNPAQVKGYGRNGGLGLAEIGERVRILKGKLEIQTSAGAGTSLRVTIPIVSDEKPKLNRVYS